MKTYDQIKTITFNDYAFFKGVSATEAKWAFAGILYSKVKDIPLTKSGSPNINAKETLHKDQFDFTMKSNSELDKQDQMRYLCDFYNKGIPKEKLKMYAYNKSCIKSLKIIGKDSIVNQILNDDQYRILQKTWVLKGCYMKFRIDEKCLAFILKHDWTIEYLMEKGVPKGLLEEELRKYQEALESKKKKKK